MRTLQITLFLIVLISLMGCSFPGNQHSISPGQNAIHELTETQAKARKAMVEQVDYELFLDLTGKDDIFSGRVVVNLQLNALKQPLLIDFHQGNISQLVINEQEVEPSYDGYFLHLSPHQLQQGQNTLEIRFTRQYSHEGKGLHRFVDPEDQRVYLYSDFEPNYASRVFPLLDQPDLKATFKLSARVPKDWQVVSIKRERKVVRDGQFRWWYFPASEKISSYVFPIHAGPYKVWEDKQFHVPLRLMARQSQQNKVSVEPLFKMTRQGINFYENYLDQPYPFSKYDQLIVPDFTYSGMEMAAATILNEDVFIEPVDPVKYPFQWHYAAQLVFHELVHMWFGNLVTMAWWNDLWLNESFADFMAFTAIDEAAGMQDGWLFFNSYGNISKQEAYLMDELPSTHPVVLPARTAHEATERMDSITYDKGASALQQLQKMLGAEVFRQGIREYLQKYREGNARMEDFIDSMEQVSGQSLDQWTRDFLTTSGVNEVQAEFGCKQGALDSLNLIQHAAQSGDRKRRQQTINIALLMVKNDQLITSRNLTTTYKGKKTKVQLTGHHPCPAAVIPNSDDQAYVIVRLDDQSRSAVTEYAAYDPMIRQLVISGLRRDLLAGRIPLIPYAQTILTLYEKEQNPLLQNYLEDRIRGIYFLTQTLKPSDKSAQKKQSELAHSVESFSWQQFDLNVDEKSQRWFDHWVSMAHTPEALEQISLYLDGKKSIKNFEVQQYQRWNMLIKLSEFSEKGVEQRVRKELKRDKSAEGKSSAMVVKAIAPSIENKRYWLNMLMDEQSDLTQFEQDDIIYNLFPLSQGSQWQFMSQEIINGLDASLQHSETFQQQYSGTLLAHECSNSGLERLERTIKQFKNKNFVIFDALENRKRQAVECMRMSQRIDN